VSKHPDMMGGNFLEKELEELNTIRKDHIQKKNQNRWSHLIMEINTRLDINIVMKHGFNIA
jgi:hypothetical protein